jgi:primosomal protein N' (replication factor Y)
MAMYYMCSLGDVYRAALPAALKLESETHVLLNPEFEAGESLTENELRIFYSLSESKPQTIAEIQKTSGISNAIQAIKSLVDKQAAYISEDIQNAYTARKQTFVCFPRDYTEEELLCISDSLNKAKKQQHLFSIFIYLKENNALVSKKHLLEEAGASASVLSELVKKGLLSISDQEISRFDYGKSNPDSAFSLNEYQQKALGEILKTFEEKDVTLLHGVTSSGKTEIYIQMIKETISKGQQVLYLLPEIALTTQITGRLKSVFGNKLAVYHSKFNDNERAEVWNNLIKNSETRIVLGARSAIFLPFSKPGLIIVDEEHESSYKQQDPAPRYNACNAAIMLGSICNTKVLLGTATPAIETYNNALAGKYGLVTLSKRHEGIELPRIEVINIKELRRKKQMKSILSPPLIDKVKEALLKKEQIILFQNRRGFSSMLECKNCSWTPRCMHCDVSLTYHKSQRMMICHYCGATYNVPAICPECQAPAPDILGYGTERIEEEVSGIFPDALPGRMDFDTTRGKKSYERIISDFENRKTDMLIGTQMVSKGLDFGNVSVVGILNADNLLNYPDFRACERAFQLMIQVSGRAGRKNKQGTVFLQTSHPNNPIVSYVKNNDYTSFYRQQMEERKIFCYPPFCRLIAIILRGRDESLTDNAAKQFARSLKESFGGRVLGPGKPPVSRIQSLYIRQIVLKIENHASVQKVRETIFYHQDRILNDPVFRSVLLHYDVDPV